ncbi:MAG: polysaccharide biosynthesis tyrosine autokinase [Bacteroidetes bacterium]|nr:polysaccharide biosynthesis tyrosine autokinase [Bacteroidota bacterium]
MDFGNNGNNGSNGSNVPFKYDALQEGKSFKDIYALIRKNLLLFISIMLVIFVISGVYAYLKPDIYEATAVIKITKSKESVLTSPFMQGFQSIGEDRFIANELEILKSYRLREKAAMVLADSFRISERPGEFYSILESESSLFGSNPINPPKLMERDFLPDVIVNTYEAKQKRGLDIIEITASSRSAYEAALLTNIIAVSYHDLNLSLNRQFLSMDREFLGEVRDDKLDVLLTAEQQLEAYQKKEGIVQLTDQAKSLIDLLSDFESKKNATRIELTISEKSLSKYKEELVNQDPRIKDYLESFATEPYIKSLQEQIAKLESQKDLAMLNNKLVNSNSSILTDFDNKINDLKIKLNEKIDVYKAGIFASSPEEIKSLTQKVLEEGIKFQALTSSFKEWSSLVAKYETKFDEIPMQSMELARLEREKKATEKLYMLVEEKYQEAQIQEQSIPGNVIIIDKARMSMSPAKPNRKLILLVGLVMGFVVAFGVLFVLDYFDTKLRTPEQLQDNNLNYISYVPLVEGVNKNGTSEVVYNSEGQSTAGEAFRTLRTRIRFSTRLNKEMKVILITSANEQEGKTFVSSNLACSFALSNKKTLLIDCDLRRPRVHKFFDSKSTPGLTEFFIGEKSFKDVLRSTGRRNLSYITSGALPPNPAEIIGSKKMEEFLEKIRHHFDLVIIDSAPILAVSDSEILARLVDGTFLVTHSGATELDSIKHAVELLSFEGSTYQGVILNKFTPQKGNGYYYRYSYTYGDNYKIKGTSKS